MSEPVSGQQATQPAPSSAPQRPGSPSPSPTDVVDVGDQGPDFLSDRPADTQVPSGERPASPSGERSGDADKPTTEKPATADKPVPDPMEAVLNFYKPQAEQKPETKPETEIALSQDAFKAIETLGADKVKAALMQGGLDEKAADQVINLNKLAGRQTTELGELRKSKETFRSAVQALSPVLEHDDKGNITGFKGLPLLEMATKKFGAQEVQNQLAQVGLRLVPVDEYTQLTTGGKAGNTQARETVIREVAKEFKIEGEDLSVKELRELIDADQDAKDTLTERLADLRVQASQADRAEKDRTREMTIAEEKELSAVYDQLKQSIPHFAEIEPVMTQMYAEVFSKGLPPRPMLLQFLARAADGATMKDRLPKILEWHKGKIEKDLLHRLGIPASEVLGTAARPVSTTSSLPGHEFSEDFSEVGPKLI